MKLETLLPLLNQWWKNGRVGSEKAMTYKRVQFEKLVELLDERQIIIVTGLRRVGKSTMLFQSIEKTINIGVDPLKILYFTFDESVDEVSEVLEAYRLITDSDWRKDKIYVFLDEIQKLHGWSSQIKMLYDNFPNIKFVISGSAGLNMEIDAIKDLAGRYSFIDVLPLYLKEFAEMYSGHSIGKREILRDEMDVMINKFIRRPFPEIVHWEDESRILEYVRSMVVEKMIYSDLPRFTKDFRPELASTLLRIFMSQVGMILNIDGLARDLGVSKTILNTHIHYLEFARLIKVISNYRPSIMSRSRKLRRVYPYHIALTTPFKYNIEIGKIFEVQTRTYLGLNDYWRKGKKEIDFIKIDGDTLIPIEVKSSKNVDPSMNKVLDHFMDRYEISRGVLIHGDTRIHEFELNGDRIIRAVPLEKVLWDGFL
jgi:hypothetical protein